MGKMKKWAKSSPPHHAVMKQNETTNYRLSSSRKWRRSKASSNHLNKSATTHFNLQQVMTRLMEMHFSNLKPRPRDTMRCLLARLGGAAQKTEKERKSFSSKPLNRTIAINFIRQSEIETAGLLLGKLIQTSPWTFQLNTIDHFT